MPTSSIDDVRQMYDETADGYSQMMDDEIELPVYADVLGRLHNRIAETEGTLLDTACGSGHMLDRYHKRYDACRPLLGIDLSPRMVAIAAQRLSDTGRVLVGDMRHLEGVVEGSCIAVLNFFALHHLDAEDIRAALGAWHRALVVGGQLVIAAWEGSGTIDYGDAAELVANRYRAEELAAWAREAGFAVTRCVVVPVEGFPMDAVYLDAAREPG